MSSLSRSLSPSSGIVGRLSRGDRGVSLSTGSSRHRVGVLALLAGLAAFAVGCMNDTEDPGNTTGAIGGESEGASNLAVACDLTKPFKAPQLVSGLGFEDRDVYSARLAQDELSAIVSVSNGANGVDFYNASRPTTGAPFVLGAAISELNTTGDEYWPTLSADGKMIFFESARAPVGGTERARIWVATRPDEASPFGAPLLLGVFRNNGPETAPYLHPLGRSLYFASGARGGRGELDLFVADITDFGVVTGVRPITSANSVLEENMPIVTGDERALFYSRSTGSVTNRDVWVVGRSTPSEEFGLAQEVVEVNSASEEFPSYVSGDGCRLYIVSNRPTPGAVRFRVWVAEKPL